MRAYVRGYLTTVADQCPPCLRGQDLLIPQKQQSPEHPGFVDIDKPYDCSACIRAHAERFKFPDLTPDNYEAWAFFHRLSDQQRTGLVTMGGVIPGTIDASALAVAFDVYDVPRDQRRALFEKVLLVSREVTGHYRAKAEAEAEREKAKTSRRLDV